MTGSGSSSGVSGTTASLLTGGGVVLGVLLAFLGVRMFGKERRDSLNEPLYQ